ncbi:hypothetical protein PHYBOEH_009449 [Phytophthora boehmeriae]|uniref:Uncharacterized protein n=1 Tax=Phytophthora boehmeriae TaxID=109152 RepID=A0A8T1VTZ0_9STRA|nr:hypothetical protein PHYBOEH_009449 [Phytophthora boehmeriae]
MGAATSTGLVDSVVDGDIHRLKTILHDHKLDAKNSSEAPTTESTKDSVWELELEEAVHTVVASEIESGQHLQQLQIALELLLQARPEIWSSTVSCLTSSDNNDDNDTITTSNPAGWSACHRACATGNLAFVVFALQHYPAQFDLQTRDVFGLFPIDLVPPELLMSTEEIFGHLQAPDGSMKPTTARSRRCLALHRLRERKVALQDEQICALLSKSEFTNTTNNQDENQSQAGGFYIAFEPRREHLAIDLDRNMGHVHERGAPLRVKYRVPRADPFLSGYFQLIWRGIGDARSEEPTYDSHITRLRDEHVQSFDQETPLQPQQLDPLQTAQVEVESQRSLNGLYANSVVEGCITVDVTDLPTDSVCHMLFIACDKHMLHRTIALSTEGLAIQAQDFDSDDYYSDSTSDEDEEDILEQNQQEVKDPGYTFFVGGEEFSHPNSVFAGQSFPDVPAFECFLRELRLKRQHRLQLKQEQENQLQEQVQTQEIQQQKAGQEAEEIGTTKHDSTEIPVKLEEELRQAENPISVMDYPKYQNEADSGE